MGVIFNISGVDFVSFLAVTFLTGIMGVTGFYRGPKSSLTKTDTSEMPKSVMA